MDTKALRQKILDLAIRGKLVPQDPNDEPAEVLLERIREQKQQMLKEGKLKKKDIKNDTIIFKGEDNLHYEKFQDGTVKCIEDEIPFEVPEGWEWCRYSDVIELYSGQDLTPDRYNDTGDGIPYITGASNLEQGKVLINRWTTTPTTHATIGDLLLTVKGSGVGKMAFCDITDAHIARQIMALRCTTAVHPHYLYIAISAMLDKITAQANGIIPGIRREIVLSALLPLPPSSEQTKICEKANNTLLIINTIVDEKEDLHTLISTAKSKILDLAIRGKLVPQNPDDEPASVLIERIRAEKEELITQGKIKRNKKESVIFKGDDNSYYEKIDGEVSCIDVEIPYDIPDTWTWMRLENCCVKEIRRGKSPKYAEISNVIVFAQKCNTKYNGIDISLAQYLDETTLKRYPTDEYMQDGDVVINSTGTGTLGRVGIYRDGDNTTGLSVVPDSHVTIIRGFSCICPYYLYAYIKAHQSELEKKGEGSTNQKELKPLTLKEMLIAIPPLSEQKRIDKMIDVAFQSLAVIEENLN